MKKCTCGSGEYRRELKDGYGIFLTFACDRCEARRLKEFRPDIMSRYECDEPIKEEIEMYTVINFKNKKALKEAVASGKQIEFYQPGPFGGKEPRDGTICVEGPHYPEPHRWYATCEVKDGFIVKVK